MGGWPLLQVPTYLPYSIHIQIACTARPWARYYIKNLSKPVYVIGSADPAEFLDLVPVSNLLLFSRLLQNQRHRRVLDPESVPSHGRRSCIWSNCFFLLRLQCHGRQLWGNLLIIYFRPTYLFSSDTLLPVSDPFNALFLCVETRNACLIWVLECFSLGDEATCCEVGVVITRSVHLVCLRLSTWTETFQRYSRLIWSCISEVSHEDLELRFQEATWWSGSQTLRVCYKLSGRIYCCVSYCCFDVRPLGVAPFSSLIGLHLHRRLLYLFGRFVSSRNSCPTDFSDFERNKAGQECPTEQPQCDIAAPCDPDIVLCSCNRGSKLLVDIPIRTCLLPCQGWSERYVLRTGQRICPLRRPCVETTSLDDCTFRSWMLYFCPLTYEVLRLSTLRASVTSLQSRTLTCCLDLAFTWTKLISYLVPL